MSTMEPSRIKPSRGRSFAVGQTTGGLVPDLLPMLVVSIYDGGRRGTGMATKGSTTRGKAANSTPPTLDSIRGTLPRGRANARSVAAVTENPGCTRRRVIEAASIPAYELAERAGFPAMRGQSPFAITSGNRFEERLKEGSGYAALVEALAAFVTLPASDPVVADLNRVPGRKGSQAWLDARVASTKEVLAQLASRDPSAPHIVDHPMLTFELAGSTVYLEPDALAFQVESGLQLVEIKSYAIIDGQADPSKVSATAGQSAVYLLAMRATLAELGFDPDLLDWSVILVAPKNFGRYPTAHRVPLRKKAMSIQRVLARVTSAAATAVVLPDGFTLDVDPGAALPPHKREQRLRAALGRLDPLYVPECLSACDLAGFCRDEAISTDNPSRLGRQARDVLGDVGTLAEARRLSTLPEKKVPPELSDVAAQLREAARALAQARAAAPAACGLTASPTDADQRGGR